MKTINNIPTEQLAKLINLQDRLAIARKEEETARQQVQYLTAELNTKTREAYAE